MQMIEAFSSKPSQRPDIQERLVRTENQAIKACTETEQIKVPSILNSYSFMFMIS